MELVQSGDLVSARNVVLHGGSTSSIALDATLRTVAPLVGAGLDRIVHHFFESGLNSRLTSSVVRPAFQ
jgi:hypothetical protein